MDLKNKNGNLREFILCLFHTAETPKLKSQPFIIIYSGPETHPADGTWMLHHSLMLYWDWKNPGLEHYNLVALALWETVAQERYQSYCHGNQKRENTLQNHNCRVCSTSAETLVNMGVLQQCYL